MSDAIKGLKASQPAPEDSSKGAKAHSVYLPAKEGPFRCDNCEYFREPNSCTNKYIIKVHGPSVEPGGCCDLFEKKD